MSLKNKIFSPIIQFDQTVHALTAGKDNRLLTIAFKLITGCGSGYVWICLYGLIYLGGDPKAQLFVRLALLAEIIGLGVIIVIRNIFPRQRPQKNIRFLAPFPWHKNSFPSQHALRAALLASLGGFFYPGTAPILATGAILICYSRLYLEKHFLSDILTGITAGICCVTASVFIQSI